MCLVSEVYINRTLVNIVGNGGIPLARSSNKVITCSNIKSLISCDVFDVCIHLFLYISENN